ncbi:MAG: hypothetical protein KJO01_08685 [Gammaproteobacteria bacterium]|nr:hypothetical protein [Gammaproteobacteria bacterium]MBT8110191.1 hypothetical protein [Gammaproteobacteria bacterium]NND47297.1 hypothetical protein [Woeseiaceae bacterium]NNL44894.1 hypothetical protein [Woeseiaceae bacterium]
MGISNKWKAAPYYVVCLLLCSTAWGQVGTVQTLDRVDVNSRSNVLEMDFADPARMADFFNTGVSGNDFRACKLTALDGLYCLDGKVVKRWPTTFDDPLLMSDDPQTIIDCNDSALDLDTRKADTCTALTVDLSGTIWLAGKNKKGPTFVLYRIVEQEGGSCPDGIELTLTQPPQPPQSGDTVYCAEQVASDKPLLIDLNSIDGDVAEAFPLGKGVLYLEARKTTVFQPDDGSSSTIIASGRKGWGLNGNEQIQSIALWQSPDGTENQVLATTDRGRVLAVAVDQNGDAGPPSEAFNVVTGRGNRDAQDPVASQCDFVNDPFYSVRTSSKSGLVYVTDRLYCEVLALEDDPAMSGFSLINAQEPVTVGSPTPTRDLTLSTADGAGSFPPEGSTVAPGIGIDLNDCAGLCTLITADNGAAAASLANVTLLNPDGPSGLTLFQIKNIPDCRYVPAACVALLGTADLSGVVISLDPSDPANPAAQRLNITPLLPTEITDLFEDIGGLPDMFMSRLTRGQQANGFTFEAFFGRTEEGVVFRSTFDGEFDVLALADAELGCQSTFPAETPVEDILLWDTVTTVSERFIGTNGERVDTLINVDCGSSKTIDGRWSLKPYNTEITPCTWTDDPMVWDSDGFCRLDDPNPGDYAETVDDAVFAKLLLALYDDFGEALDQLACVNVDVAGPADPPLSPGVCSTAQAQWANGLDKLEKCWDATQQPKQSSGNQNCQSFVSQFDGLRSTILAATPFGPDPANRVGELVARLAVIDHVYEDRFVPSIPAGGFVEP